MHRFSPPLLSIIIFLLIISPVFSDEEEDYFDFGLTGGLVITAGRTPEPMEEVPAQIIVITAEDINESGAVNLRELLERIPGVRFSGAMSGAGSEAISMRGFGENSFGRVLILVDGNRINLPDMNNINWNSILLSDIERIELMDGSASVQYGNNAVGGVINIITRRRGERQTIAGLGFGSFFPARSSPFIPSPWGNLFHRQFISHFQPASWGSFSISGENTISGGYRDRQASRSSGLGAGVNVFLQSNLRLSFNASYSNLGFQLPGSLTGLQFEENPRQAINQEDENSEHYFSGGFGLQWFPAEDMELNLPISYKGNIRKTDMASFFSFSDRSLHSFEARPQVTFSINIGNMPLRLLGGVDFYYANLNVYSYGTPERTGTPDNLRVGMWTLGPYINARLTPIRDLTFSLGLRFDIARVNAVYTAMTGFDGTKFFNAFVYETGVVYNPMENLRLYARFSSLFRYPFIEEVADAWNGFNDNLVPERGFNTELGASYSYENILDINGNFFFMSLKDEIAYNSATWTNENMDNTRRIGINIGLSLKPLDFISPNFLNLTASYSFVNAVFTNGPNSGNFIPLVPAHNINGSIIFTLPFGLELGPDFMFTSSSYDSMDTANSMARLKSYFLLGFSARYNFDIGVGDLSILLTGKNLLNASYSPLSYWGGLYPADGRSISISLQYRF